ncbi:MAG: energy transducer TonB [Nevskiales bacterium]|nr:energy transducer TonB [Nevskiales bacterium]
MVPAARIPVAVPLAALITFAAFFVMHLLISTGRSALTDEPTGRVVDFVRVKQEEQIAKKERKPERPPKPEKPPETPKPQMQQSTAKVDQSMSIGAVSADVDINVDVGLDGGGSDGEYLPIVKVQPVYPQRALQRRIEGWVLVEFTVTASGAVKDVSVVDADPENIFDRAAVAAAEKFRYKPRVINGKPVEVQGVQNLIRFQLAKD